MLPSSLTGSFVFARQTIQRKDLEPLWSIVIAADFGPMISDDVIAQRLNPTSDDGRFSLSTSGRNQRRG
jgi:hypothetical protein